MKTGRRGFFGLLGGAAVAGPSLVREAAATASAGFGSAGSAAETYPIKEGSLDSSLIKKTVPPLPAIFSGAGRRKAFVKQFGFPQYLIERWANQARFASERSMDADLIANRSMSQAGRVAEQHRRHVEKMKHEWLNEGTSLGWAALQREAEKRFPWIDRL